MHFRMEEQADGQMQAFVFRLSSFVSNPCGRFISKWYTTHGSTMVAQRSGVCHPPWRKRVILDAKVSTLSINGFDPGTAQAALGTGAPSKGNSAHTRHRRRQREGGTGARAAECVLRRRTK